MKTTRENSIHVKIVEFTVSQSDKSSIVPRVQWFSVATRSKSVQFVCLKWGKILKIARRWKNVLISEFSKFICFDSIKFQKFHLFQLSKLLTPRKCNSGLGQSTLAIVRPCQRSINRRFMKQKEEKNYKFKVETHHHPWELLIKLFRTLF